MGATKPGRKQFLPRCVSPRRKRKSKEKSPLDRPSSRPSGEQIEAKRTAFAFTFQSLWRAGVSKVQAAIQAGLNVGARARDRKAWMTKLNEAAAEGEDGSISSPSQVKFSVMKGHTEGAGRPSEWDKKGCSR